MKTEHEIAKENVERVLELKKKWDSKGDDRYWVIRGSLFTHLASCQRFLEFCNWLYNDCGFKYRKKPDNRLEELEVKIKDLQNAIKVYQEAGIK